MGVEGRSTHTHQPHQPHLRRRRRRRRREGQEGRGHRGDLLRLRSHDTLSHRQLQHHQHHHHQHQQLQRHHQHRSRRQHRCLNNKDHKVTDPEVKDLRQHQARAILSLEQLAKYLNPTLMQPLSLVFFRSSAVLRQERW